jgi:hypothetical protein
MGMNPRLLRPILSGDPDALRYIAAVQAADQQSLELPVRKAITDFIVGCKADGIWAAIKACCFLAGPRTLAGINVPLVGPTPVFNSFTTTQYNRKTGLIGNASTMFIDSNRGNSEDGQNDAHMCVWVTEALTTGAAYIGRGRTANGTTHLGRNNTSVVDFARNRANTVDTLSGGVYDTAGTGFMGISRDNSATYNFRTRSTNNSFSRTSQSPLSGNVHVFGQNDTTPDRSNVRLAFYSVGAALTLSLLESRVSAYVSAIDGAI